MDKQNLLNEIKSLSSQDRITKQELLEAYYGGQKKYAGGLMQNLNVSRALYYIGSAIIFLGIIILIYQQWNHLTFGTRLIVTLGSAIAAYISGAIFSRYGKYENLSAPFFLISALLSPIGLWVLFDRAGLDTSKSGVQMFMSGILFLAYFASVLAFKKTLFKVFLFTFGTWLFFSAVSFLVDVSGGRTIINEVAFYEYRFLVAGASYMLFGYWFSDKESDSALSGPLYGFGSLFFLGSALALGKYRPEQNYFWEIIYPGLVFALVILSVHIKSRSILTFGSLFLMIYILKITSEYFSDSYGWALSLVVAGLSIIAVGYYSVYINRKFIARDKTSSQ